MNLVFSETAHGQLVKRQTRTRFTAARHGAAFQSIQGVYNEFYRIHRHESGLIHPSNFHLRIFDSLAEKDSDGSDSHIHAVI